jgi:hypothetical protein
MAKKLFKSKTNFTLRRLHQSGNYGNIYERDYSTIVDSLGNIGEQIPVYSSPSFKLSVRAGLNRRKKYSYGNWVENPNNCEGNDGNVWTLGCMPNIKSSSSEIRLKQTSKRLTDFACYGSSSELIRSSLTNIVCNYPGELYVTDRKLRDAKLVVENGSIPEDSELYKSKYIDMFIVENPLNIDIIQNSIPTDSIVSKIRYFCETRDKYTIINKKNTSFSIPLKFWDNNLTTSEGNKTCLNNGDLLAIVTLSGDTNYLIDKNSVYYIWEENEFKPFKPLDADGNTGDLLVIPTIKDRYKYIKVNGVYYFWDNIKYVSCKPYESTEENTLYVDDVNGFNSNEVIIKIYCFYYEGEIIYICDNEKYLVRPNKESINEFFNSLGDFENTLLNRQTNFTSTFDTYIEDDENGWFISEVKYKWPTGEGGWNLSVNGMSYLKYIDDLTTLANGYDEKFTNSIWRDMTHESIVNMDLTSFIGSNYDDVSDNTKMRQAICVIGRQFDDIKKYIDGIKSVNTLTYSQEKNSPDYFLTDSLENYGWDMKEIMNFIPKNFNANDTYPSSDMKINTSDANNDFMRKLRINSKCILSKKGTKQGIEDLLAIFGFHSIDWLSEYKRLYNITTDFKYEKAYKIIEYVNVADGYFKNPELGISDICNEVKRINQLKDSYNIDNINDPDYVINPFQGLPAVEAIIGGESRLIPWYDKNEKYDSNLYYEMKGGWSMYDGYETYVKVDKLHDSIENNLSVKSSITEVYELPKNRLNPIVIDVVDEFNGETTKVSLYYVKYNGDYYEWQYVNKNKYDYTISNVYYVDTINDLYHLTYNSLKENDIYYINDISSYYKLIDIENFKKIEGWVELTDSEVQKIIGIVESNKGNNPHTGEFDGGNGYYKSYASLFDSSTFDNARREITKDVASYGFNIKRYADSTKCLFYGSEHEMEKNLLRKVNNIKPYDFSGTGTTCEKIFTEVSSLSVINSKQLHIIFDCRYREFIEVDVIPYLKQVIPSTTIFSYSFRVLYDGDKKNKAIQDRVICEGGICPIFAVTE